MKVLPSVTNSVVWTKGINSLFCDITNYAIVDTIQGSNFFNHYYSFHQ